LTVVAGIQAGVQHERTDLERQRCEHRTQVLRHREQVADLNAQIDAWKVRQTPSRARQIRTIAIDDPDVCQSVCLSHG